MRLWCTGPHATGNPPGFLALLGTGWLPEASCAGREGDSSGTALDSPVLLWYLKLRLATEVSSRLVMKQPAEVRRVASVVMEGPGEPDAGFPIGVVSDLLGVTEQTLRLYELQGLVKPARRNRERYYCTGDVQWLECLRHLIHTEKVSIEGVKRLLHFAPCWEIGRASCRERVCSVV